jgi:hypothetical protein
MLVVRSSTLEGFRGSNRCRYTLKKITAPLKFGVNLQLVLPRITSTVSICKGGRSSGEHTFACEQSGIDKASTWPCAFSDDRSLELQHISKQEVL